MPSEFAGNSQKKKDTKFILCISVDNVFFFFCCFVAKNLIIHLFFFVSSFPFFARLTPPPSLPLQLLCTFRNITKKSLNFSTLFFFAFLFLLYFQHFNPGFYWQFKSTKKKKVFAFDRLLDEMYRWWTMEWKWAPNGEL